MAVVHGISVNEALSGIFGSISLTSWICLLVRDFPYLQLATSHGPASLDWIKIDLTSDIDSSTFDELQGPERRRPVYAVSTHLVIWRYR